jgi:hypothetical protein
MKYCVILFLCLTVSCAKDKPQFSVYEVDLMKDAYKRNNVKGFVKSWIVNGKRINIDSTILNSNGNIQNVFRLIAFGGADTLRYDSLNRLIGYSHRSDVWRDFKIIYEQLPEDRKVIQSWIDVTDNDSVLAYENTINYNLTLDTIVSISTPMIGDTILTIKYSYKKNRLVEIGPDNQDMSSRYIYNERGHLDQTIKYYKGRPFEVEFLSNTTGLPDSVLKVPEMTDSFANKLDFRKYSFDKNDMTYYSYFK